MKCRNVAIAASVMLLVRFAGMIWINYIASGQPCFWNFNPFKIMKRLLTTLVLLVYLPVTLSAQKRVLSYPFEFEKSFLAKSDYDAYFLDNANQNSFALVLHDNKKADYVLLDKAFKVISNFTQPIRQTIFNETVKSYVGGTVNNNTVFRFVYENEAKKEYSLETVDFNARTISHKILLEVPRAEKLLCAFSDNNIYFSVAAMDKTSELVLYSMNADGGLMRKAIAFPIPETSKNKNKLSAYLEKMVVIKSTDEPDLSDAVKPVKLFSEPGSFTIVVNEVGSPAFMHHVRTSDLNLSHSNIDFAPLTAKEDRGKLYVSSFLKDKRLYSMMLNKKNIRIAVHDVASGEVLRKLEINEDEGVEMIAVAPVSEIRMGKQAIAKDVDNIKKVIRAFTRGAEGLMVSQVPGGKLVLTAGTYDAVPSYYTGAGGRVEERVSAPGPTPANGIPVTYTVYRPGYSAYIKPSARFYSSTYFKMQLDPVTLKVAKGRLVTPVSAQIKDYIEGIDSKAKATNQFTLDQNQYYGYYDRDLHAYIVELIKIFK